MDPPYAVLRCKNCEARVLYESDVLSVETSDAAKYAVVERAVNLQVYNGSITCARCGYTHFRGTNVELNHLPLTLDGEDVFYTSKMRVLVYIQAETERFYHMEEAGVDDDGDPITKPVVDERSHGIRALNYFAKIGKKLVPPADIIQRNIASLKSSVTRTDAFEIVREFIDYADMECSQVYEWYNELTLENAQEEVFGQTYDVVIVIKVEDNRFMYWTDFNAVGTEELLVMSWLVSGGNLLFGQWGVPRNADGDYGRSLSVESVIAELRDGSDETETQVSLAELIENGHFLGWWPVLDESPPATAINQITKALNNRIFPEWLFKSDFPMATFAQPARQWGAQTLTLQLQDPFHEEELPPKPEGIVSTLVDLVASTLQNFFRMT